MKNDLETMQVEVEEERDGTIEWRPYRDIIICTGCGFGLNPAQPWFQDEKCVLMGERDFRPRYCPGCGRKTGPDNVVRVELEEWEILSAFGETKLRCATEREREYIQCWHEMGLSQELIVFACEHTYSKKLVANWPYANVCLKKWVAAACFTPEQVRAQKLC